MKRFTFTTVSSSNPFGFNSRFLITILLLLQAMFCLAKQVTKEQSLNIAQQFYSEQKTSKVFKVKAATAPEFKLDYISTDVPIALSGRALAPPATNDSTAYYYVYNIGDKQGFIIVSGDDRTKPILGYSDEGAFTPENIPEHVIDFMDNYKNQIKAIMQRNDTTAIQKVMKVVASNDSAVAPLISTKWGQDAPYNSRIPVAAPTGCVATAMAQVMNYYKWPVKGTLNYSYNYGGHNFKADFGLTSYDWANMLNVYSTRDDVTSVNCKAVATLMYHCGVSVDMEYSETSSGAYFSYIPYALINYFGYDKSVKYISYDTTQYTPTQWKYQIMLEIKDRRPVMISGSNDSIGHAYIADGYDSYNFVHLNWGWDNFYNGYYEIDPLDGSSYFVPNAMIIGIQKPLVTSDTINLSYDDTGLNLNYGKTLIRSNPIYANIMISNYKNGYQSFTGEIKLDLYKNGLYCTTLIRDSLIIKSNSSLQKRFTFSIPDTLSVGIYNLVPLSKSKDGSIWTELKYEPLSNVHPNMSETIELIISKTNIVINKESKTINCKKSEFRNDFTYDNWQNIEHLVVNGEVDQWDLMYMASARSIKSIDLKNATILDTDINTSNLAYGGKPGDFYQFYSNLSSKWKNLENYFWHGVQYKEGDPKWEKIKGNYSFRGLSYDPNTKTYYATYDQNLVDVENVPQDNVQILGSTESSGDGIAQWKISRKKEIKQTETSSTKVSFYIGGKGIMADIFSNSSIENIILPTTLKYIAPMAFANCPNLKSISLPDSVCLIGDSVFYNSPNITEIKFPKALNSIWAQGLNSLKNLITITLPNVAKKIDDNSFANCFNLNSIVLPDSLQSIGNSAFKNCSKLTSIVLPDKLKDIGKNSFKNCTGIKSMAIPIAVSAIGSSAFSNCSALTSIKVSKSVPIDLSSSDSVFYGVNKTNCTLYVPNNSKTLYKASSQWKDFINLMEAKSVIITAGGLSTALTTIEKSTLTDLTILGTMDARDFKVLRDSIPLLSDLNLGSVTIVAYTGTIGTIGTTSTTYLANEIPQNAFSISGNRKISLKKIIFPTSCTSIGDYAFMMCSGLRSFILPSSVTTIGYSAFKECIGLTSIIIPSSVKVKGSSIFANCTGLTTATFESGVTSIGDTFFYGCTGLKSVNIPSSVSNIAGGAFNLCSGLTSITIPESVKTIGNNAFSNCIGLTALVIPSTVTNFGNAAFSNCSGLTTLIISSGLTNLGLDGATFASCTGLTSVVIPTSVTSIGSSVFFGCTGLSSITIPPSVSTIGYEAFYGCSGLTSLTISNGVNSIGESAFENCTGLTSLIMPLSVSVIKSYAFKGCSGLSSIKVFNKVPIDLSSSYYVFEGENYNCTLYVPFGSKDTYSKIHPWDDFYRIIEMNGLTVSTNRIAMPVTSVSSDSIIINSNVSWTVSADQTWLTLNTTTGNGNDTLTLAATANKGTSRKAIISISTPDLPTETITVIQAGEADPKQQDFYSKKIVSCSSGAAHSLAIDESGNLWTWGYNRYGQLGDGTLLDKTIPTPFLFETKISKVSGGAFHTLAIDDLGNLWGWGLNLYGQLGDGTNIDKSIPIQIMSGTKFKSISAGGFHSMAIDDSGNLWTWGDNEAGELGDGTTANKLAPVKIMSGTKFKSISGGGLHSSAIDEAGNLWLWGSNIKGQLGNGTTASKSIPMQIKTGTIFQSVISGGDYSMLIDDMGNLWASGLNANGQLGDGTTTDKSTFTQIKSGTLFQTISGYYHSLVIDRTQNLWTYGRNSYGQLGDGTTADKNLPINIMSNIKFKAIATGYYHSMAIDISGNLLIWGNNTYGQLGDGSTTNKITPFWLNTKNMTDIIKVDDLGYKVFGGVGIIKVQTSKLGAKYSIYNLIGNNVSNGVLQQVETDIHEFPGLYIFSAGDCNTKVLVK